MPRKSQPDDHRAAGNSTERRLTKEAIDHLIRTSDAAMRDRRFSVSTTDLLRAIRAGEPIDTDEDDTQASQ